MGRRTILPLNGLGISFSHGGKILIPAKIDVKKKLGRPSIFWNRGSNTERPTPAFQFKSLDIFLAEIYNPPWIGHRTFKGVVSAMWQVTKFHMAARECYQLGAGIFISLAFGADPWRAEILGAIFALKNTRP
ncbi:MAG: hypothetical protein WCB96_05095 [Candidatus Aminicenantales bacterium]